MRSSDSSRPKQLLAFCGCCSNSARSVVPPFAVGLLFLLFPVHCAVDVGLLKHCFERYDGRRIVRAAPFLSEWRRSGEEQCLEFCVRSSSRCGAIVYDKGGHICHYFNPSDSTNLVPQRKFVYLRVTDRNCTESLKLKLLVKESPAKTHKNAEGTEDSGHFGTKLAGAKPSQKRKMPMPSSAKFANSPATQSLITTTTNAQRTVPTAAKTASAAASNASVSTSSANTDNYYGGRNRNSSSGGGVSGVPTIVALLAELDAELAKQTQMAPHLPPPISIAANGIGTVDEAVALAKLAKKGSMQTDREIRRSPRINDRGGEERNNFWPHKNANMPKELFDAHQHQLNEMMPGKSPAGGQYLTPSTEEDTDGEQSIAVGAENFCDSSSGLSHRVWLAVENSRLARADSGGQMPPQKAANTPRECVRVCTNLMIGTRPCNSFVFFEREKRCVFGHSGDAFPSHGTLESIRNGDFSQRTFRQFCFSASLSPFENCAEFLAFADYRLETEPREVFDGLPTTAEGLSACIELCVLSSDFRCMSASFDYAHGICRLFHEQSLSNPNAFREHSDQNQLYFENGCVDSAGEITEETSQMGSVRRMRQKI